MKDLRDVKNFNLGWKFHRHDIENGSYRGLDDTEFKDVTLPHDWSVEGDFSQDNASGGGYLPGGIGWYRKHFFLAEELKGKRIYITFDGVYNNSHMWCNSNNVGKRPYGYSAFTYDITPYVEFGADNVIAMKVNHKETADSRWFTGSGIYRDVTLTICDSLHIAEYGVFASTSDVTKDSANMNISVDVANDTGCDISADVKAYLINSDGDVVANAASCVDVADDEAGAANLSLTVVNPVLWDMDNPYLYDLYVEIEKDGVKTDSTTTRVGIRKIEFDADKGFFLNDVNHKLKGVCLHHDAGCLGGAVPKKVWERRLTELRDMGCNSIRSAHNPPSTVLLEACDEMGFLVMDEAFDEWEGFKNKWWQGHNVYPPKHFGYAEDFPQWCERDIKTMVRRDRNHPSIILWSIGNEVDYPNDPYCHPAFETMTGNNDKNKPAAERVYDANKPNAQRLKGIARMLTKYVKQCDVTRPVTIALAFPELSNIINVSEEVDIVGYNYKEHLYADDHKKYPNRVLYGSENGSSLEKWLAVKDNDYISGQYIWTGIDYMGEAHGWPIRVAVSGFMDLAGYRKPKYYYRQSLWTDKPMVYISTVDIENSKSYLKSLYEQPSWDLEAGEEVVVSCYTNCEAVELFLNDVSLGKKTASEYTDAYGEYNVAYEEGSLKAVGYMDGKPACEFSLNTPSSSQRLELCAADDEINADGQDISHVYVYMMDDSGNRVCKSMDDVTIDVEGAGRLLGIENGNLKDTQSYANNHRTLYYGRLLAYVASNGDAGTITVKAGTKDGMSASVDIIAK